MLECLFSNTIYLQECPVLHVPTLFVHPVTAVAQLPVIKISVVIRTPFMFHTVPQDCMRQAVNGVGGLSHEEWRSFSSERKKGVCKNFIDGDLIEQFVDLKRDTMQWVVDRMGDGTTIEELSKTVEELSRLH